MFGIIDYCSDDGDSIMESSVMFALECCLVVGV